MSAVVLQEELVDLYNTGALSPRQVGQEQGRRPNVPLVAVHPKEGTFNLDHPFVVLRSADKRQRGGGRLPEVPDRGHPAGKVCPPRLPGPRASRLGGAARQRRRRTHRRADLLRASDPQVVGAMLDGWRTLRKKANILIALDTSGSMQRMVGTRTRFQVAAAAAGKGLALLNTEDRVGLWSFSSETKKWPKSPYREEVLSASLTRSGSTARSPRCPSRARPRSTPRSGPHTGNCSTGTTRSGSTRSSC
ncbi:VWA domain-containing protein [Micromonospora sp. M12]